MTRPAELRDRQGGTTPPSPDASPSAAAASESASAPAPAETPPPSKFTVLLDPDAAADFDQLAVDIRRLLGRRVSKGNLVRALITLATADLTLRDRLLNELRARPMA
ncbi:MAG TPA: hypothetical protein VK887_01585 [Pseudonocardiaceae bacterium]|nr:hypothetical protein [Pseudonocardiaceae bacterium]